MARLAEISWSRLAAIAALLLSGCSGSQPPVPDAGHVVDGGPASMGPVDGGPPLTSACAGSVLVDAGLLAASTAGQGLAASAFTSVGAWILLTDTATDGCAMETTPWGSLSSTGANIRLTLAPHLGPGTYALGPDAGPEIEAMYSWAYGGAGGSQALQSGSVVLTTADSTHGFAGQYHLDFGPSLFGGTGSTTGGGGTTTSPPLNGEMIEVGTFSAPVCDLCGTPPLCGDAGCAADEVCVRGCGGPDGTCVPAPTCAGAPSCETCPDPSDGQCGPGGGSQLNASTAPSCMSFDGASVTCNCLP